MGAKKLSFLFVSYLIFNSQIANAALVEALLARVGREAVTLSSLTRFSDVEKIMQCAGLRSTSSPEAKANMQQGLEQYLEEELIYVEATGKKKGFDGLLPLAIQAIHKKENCLKNWQNLGERYTKLWSTSRRPRDGESMLVRELEKRMMIDKFSKEQIQGDRSAWLREEKVKIPIKLYTD